MIGKGTDERNRTGKRYEVRKVGNVRVDVSGMFIIMCLLQREAEIEKKGQYNQPAMATDSYAPSIEQHNTNPPSTVHRSPFAIAIYLLNPPTLRIEYSL